MIPMTQQRLIMLSALFMLFAYNDIFFKHLVETYPLTLQNTPFLFSVSLLMYALFTLLLTLVSSKALLKPIVIFSFIVASLVSYFMHTYHIVVDKTMIENTLQTNLKESQDLWSLAMLFYLLFLGILPAWFVSRVALSSSNLKESLIAKTKLFGVHLLLIVVILFSFSNYYTSFFREHKELRLYTNPLTPIYNFVAYTYYHFKNTNTPIDKIGLDAKQVKKEPKRKIVVMVVGEAARSDHFSLNGYDKKTNPLLEKEDIVNFSQLYSCGTTTAVSVPCMFSVYDRDSYNSTKGRYTYNALDILSHAGVDVLWRDNNSDSKGVAVRVKYSDYKTPKNNTICDVECRDEGMLVGLQERIEETKNDILIVLHQMGNHGPAYYKRVPKSFEHFNPICKTNQLEQCSKEEISNAYDNAILYTDSFLSKVIKLLKGYENRNNTAMIYMADHGESLGENGLYLHGLPYFIAPDNQKHVGALMWFGKAFPIDREKLQAKASKRFSHDNLFSTLLGLFEVQTKEYRPKMDMLRE